GLGARGAEVEAERGAGETGGGKVGLALDRRGVGVAVVADPQLAAGDADLAGVGVVIVVGLGPVAGPAHGAVVVGVGNGGEVVAHRVAGRIEQREPGVVGARRSRGVARGENRVARRAVGADDPVGRRGVEGAA